MNRARKKENHQLEQCTNPIYNSPHIFVALHVYFIMYIFFRHNPICSTEREYEILLELISTTSCKKKSVEKSSSIYRKKSIHIYIFVVVIY
jgi:hypothetical protein